MRVLVCTVVHHTTDARIFRREIGALLAAGHTVTSVAPWPAATASDAEHARIRIPRAVGRRRFAAWRAARARIRQLAGEHEVVIVHDPELLLMLPWWELRRTRTRVIWDVHEDLAAALLTKAYLPAAVRPLLARAVRLVERLVETRATLLLAEHAYQQRFRRTHAAVLNLPLVPADLPRGPRKRQAVYVGSITAARGLHEMLAAAPLLAEHDITLRLIGEAPSARDAEAIRATANVQWDGPLPNVQALAEVEASMVGLALLHDLPNYRHSMPTKILEYMAAGTAVVATPLPLSQQVLADCGVLLPDFAGDAAAVARLVAAIVGLCDDPQAREQLTAAAFARVQAEYDWNAHQHAFVRVVEGAG